ncbi:MAG: hypothetical protein IKO47_04035 [Ruminococcus sp.]|nr:hypothetical protein [Ruminococcus sp.]
MDKEILDRINRFTRRPLTEEEVYVFSVILCDNEIDRDCERFSDEALDELRELFIGKTGIFDHDPTTSNQNARIFDTAVIEDGSRKTKYGKPYRYLKAEAYMVRTGDNRDLIAEIDGGIKKEVSISCSASQRVCSVCGCDKSSGGCEHIRGRLYGGKLCHTVLSGITDAYEWSFVAVPAQVGAGVTKRFSESGTVTVPVTEDISAADDELRRDIRRLAYFVAGTDAAKAVGVTCRGMDTKQLIALKKSLENRRVKGGIKPELAESTGNTEDNSGFSMK